jgi:drug/metabolite transporter (DMT)-like permease
MPFPSLSREHLGLLLGFVGMAIFGATLPATRIAVSAIDPIALTALRTAIAGLCALALLIVLRRPLPPRRLWLQLAIAMLCVSVLFPFLMALAMQTVDASHGGVVLGILPIATALVAVVITHERPKPLFWIASIIGAALVIAFAMRQGGGALSAGGVLQRRDDHAANAAVRRGRGSDRGDQHAHARPENAGRRGVILRRHSAADRRPNSVACRSNSPR